MEKKTGNGKKKPAPSPRSVWVGVQFIETLSPSGIDESHFCLTVGSSHLPIVRKDEMEALQKQICIALERYSPLEYAGEGLK